MRLPLAVDLESRDGTLDQDALIKNGIVESRGEAAPPVVRKRPGLTDMGLVRAGAAQLLYYWNSKIRTVIGDYIGAGYAPRYANATTWNSADKDSEWTLSNGDLTATHSGTGGGIARSIYGHATTEDDPWYFEVEKDSGTWLEVGVANASHSTAAQLGTTANSLSYRTANGACVYNNVTTVFTGATLTAGDILGVLYSPSDGTVKFYKNGVLQGTATSANVPTGTLYAAVGNGSTSSVAIANFGATSFTYTPSGVSSADLSPSSAGLQFSAQDNGESAGERLLMIKNATQGWTVDTSDTATAITDVDYPGSYKESVVSLTRSSTTATAQVVGDTKFQVGDVVTIAGAGEADYNGSMTITAVTKAGAVVNGESLPITITRSSTTATATCTSGPHGLVTGDTVTISGAEQSEYNGTKTITRTSATAFTFTVTVTDSSLTTPATGTIIAGVYGTISADKLSVTSSVATVYCSAAHGLVTGAVVQFSFNYLTYGASAWTYFSTSASITRVDDFSFTIAAAGVPDIASSSKYAGSYGIPFPIYGSPFAFLPGSNFSVSSLTCTSAGLVTVTTSAAHGLALGVRHVQVYGANQSYYNGQFTSAIVTGTSTIQYEIVPPTEKPATPATGTITAQKASTLTGGSFQYTVANSPSTPATGTITAAINRETVPGIAYLNGYFCVMDERGVIFNSAQDDPQAWNALDYTTAQNETGAGVAIARSQNYLVAFKEWSTEFFYDAKNAVGSPFSPVENAFTQIGCANGWSIASVDGMLIWVSQARQKGRSVHVMSGMEQRKVSTAAVDRVLNADALTTVYAYCVKLDGHPLYVLTLTDSAVTLVYDIASGVWSTWTACTIGSSKSVTTITRSGVIATVTTGTAHGLSDGDPVQISGATQSAYNGIFNALVTSTTAFEIQVSGSPATPATGTILAYPFSESYFNRTHYCNAGGVDVTLHATDGHLYELDPSTGQDDGVPINFFIRTQRIDGGDNARKRLASVGLVGVTVSDTAAIRWSDNDCSTYVAYRPIDLSLDDPTLRRCGAFRRRTLEVRHVGDGFPVLEALEMEPGR